MGPNPKKKERRKGDFFGKAMSTPDNSVSGPRMERSTRQSDSKNNSTYSYAQRLRERAPPALTLPRFPCVTAKAEPGDEGIGRHENRGSSIDRLTLGTSRASINAVNAAAPTTSVLHDTSSLAKKTLTMLWWSPPRQLDLEGVELPSPRDAEVERVAAQLPPEAARLYRFLGKEGFKRLMTSFYADC